MTCHRTLVTTFTAALLVLACGACASGGTASSSSTASSTTPALTVASPADLCHQYTETFLNSARDHVPDAVAIAEYDQLAQAGRRVDPVTASAIQQLADAMRAASTKTTMSYAVSSASGRVLTRCKRLGYPLTAAEVQELRNLLIQTFEPSTTTTVRATP